MLNDVEEFLKKHKESDLQMIEEEFTKNFPTEHGDCVKRMFADIREFIITEPRLPSAERDFVPEIHPQISVTDSRDEIISHLRDLSTVSEMALLSLYAYRDMASTDWRPFVKAAIERNPVCHAAMEGKGAEEIYRIISGLTNASIYDSGRMAQPDEVWNFGRGDGAEKAFLMADAIIHNDPDAEVNIAFAGEIVTVWYGGKEFNFSSSKGHIRKIRIRGNGYSVV